jgi:hypothetical protein
MIPVDLSAALNLLARGCTRKAIAAHLGVSAGVAAGRPGRPPASTPLPTDPLQVRMPGLDPAPLPDFARARAPRAAGDLALFELRRLQEAMGITRAEVEAARRRA